MGKEMQINEINEEIKVGAVFDDHKVIPKWFYWAKRKHEIKKIEHTWRAKDGEAGLIFFSVTAGANVYEIRLNQKTLEWHLEKIYTEG